MAKEKEEEKDLLALALAKITKEYGKGAIMMGEKMPDIPKQSTGILSFDLALGGGFGIGKIVEVWGPPSSGKALSLDSKILTPNGWTTMGEIKVGDAVVSDGGYTEYVSGVFPQGVQPTFEVKLQNGKKVKCTLDHLWSAWSENWTSKVNIVEDKIHKYAVGLRSGFTKVVNTAEILSEIEQGVDVYLPYYLVDTQEELRYTNPNIKTLKFYSKIVSVTRVEDTECQCISLFGIRSKLFITDDFIVTHNTTVSIHSMVQAQIDQPDKVIAIIDAEHALDSNYCKALGLDMSKILICQPDNGEQGTQIALELIETGRISFLLVDSIAALTPKVIIDGEMEQNTMGAHARMMSKFLSKAASLANKTGTTIYMTNQTRNKIGTYGNPEITTGGESPKFYASQRIELKAKLGEKDEDKNLTHKVVTATVAKNKIAPPFKSCEMRIGFGVGVDKVFDTFEIALKFGFIKVTGRTYSYGEVKLGTSREDAYKLYCDNIEMQEEIYSRAIDTLKNGTEQQSTPESF